MELILFWRICHLDIFTDTHLTDITTVYVSLFNGVLCGYFLPISVVIEILLHQVLLLLLLIITVPGMCTKMSHKL